MIQPEDNIFEFIKNFREDCYKIYGVSVDVKIDKLFIKTKVPISEIVGFIEYLMQSDELIKPNVRMCGLRDKTRFEELIVYRQCAYWFLRNQGFTCKAVAKVFKQCHATIVHGTQTINTLLHVKDPFTFRIFNRIQDELKEKFKINTVVKPNPRKWDDT